MSNCHLLVFLTTSDMLPLEDHLGDLCMAIRNKDAELARRWSKSEQWCTVIQLMQASREPRGSGDGFLRSSAKNFYILSPAELQMTPLKMHPYFSTPYLSEK
nr:nuclear protein localization protein 4 homolog [Pocillopora verrucosa]